MTFTEYKNLIASKKIVLLEIDLPLKSTQRPTMLLNYEPGIWFIKLTPDPILDITARVISLIPNPIPDDGLDIGSVIINDQNMIKVPSLPDLRLQDQSFMYDIATTKLYFHFHEWEPPNAGLYLVRNIIIGQTTGFCDKEDSDEGCYFGDVWYEPRIASIPSISKKKDPLFFGITRYTGGDVTLINDDGFFDNYKSLSIYRQRAALKIGFDGLDYANYYTLFSGYIFGYNWDFGKFTIKLQDPRNLLSKSIPYNQLTISDFPYLSESNIGKLKPIAYGTILNAPLICLNEEQTGPPANFNFLLMDTEFYSVTSVQNVYVNEVLLSSAYYTLNASAGTISIQQAKCIDDLGNVTADFTGVNITNSLAIAKDLIYRYMDISFIPTNFNIAEWNNTQANVLKSYVYEDDAIEVKNILEKLCIDSDVNIFVQDDGKYTARLYNGEKTPVRQIYNDEWLGQPSSNIDESQFSSSLIIKYANDIANGKPRQYINKDYEAAVVLKYKSYQQKEIETTIPDLAGAEAKSIIIMNYSSNIPQIVKRKTKIQNIDLSIMDLVVASPDTRTGEQENLAIWEITEISKNLSKFEIDLTMRFVKYYVEPIEAEWFAGRLWNQDIFFEKLYSISYGG